MPYLGMRNIVIIAIFSGADFPTGLSDVLSCAVGSQNISFDLCAATLFDTHNGLHLAIGIDAVPLRWRASFWI